MTGLGSGALLALAAVLWLVYLVPSWLRRNEYLATERNALRLQQTIRVLAETTEVPIAIRTDTSARSIAVQQRSLRQQQQLTDAVNRAHAAAATRSHAQMIVQNQPAFAHVVASRSSAVRRLRRTRAVTALILLASLITFASQTALMVTTGVAAAAPTVLTIAAVTAASTFLLLGRLAAISRVRARAARPVAVQTRRRSASGAEPVQPALQQRPRAWTPVAIPKPLYLSRDVVERSTFDQHGVLTDLEDAAAKSDLALRSAQAQAMPVSMPDVETPTGGETAPAWVASTTTNRFAAMGIVDVDHSATPNLDDVLRRRRQAAS